MKLDKRIGIHLLRKVQDLLELHRVAAFFPRFPRVSSLAKLAIDDTNIGVIDVSIDVVISDVAVQTLPNAVRQTAKSDQIVRAIEFDTVFERKAFAATHSVSN